MKKLFGTILLILSTVVGVSAEAQSFPTRLYCVSNFNGRLVIHESLINEYAMTEIQYSHEEWSFEANVMELKLNSVTLSHLPSGSVTQVHSLTYPLNHLSVSLMAQNKKSDVDCDLR